MAITAVDKVKINKYLKEHANGDIYYLDLCDAIGKRGKVSDVEFLEYFTDYAVKQFREGSKISTNHLTKVMAVIDSFVGWVHESKSDIKDELLDKIRNLANFYDDYLERTGIEKNEQFFNNSISVVLDKINKLYPSEVANESVSKYITKIAELEELVKKLEKEIEDTSKLCEVTQKAHDKKSEKVSELRTEISSLERSVKSKDKETTVLSATIEELREQVSSLQAMLANVQAENVELAVFKEQFEDLTVKVKQLRKTIREDKAAKKAAEDLEERHADITSLLYQKLLFERVDVDSLVQYVKAYGYESDKGEISGLISNMKRIINIDSSRFSLKPTYRIVPPAFTEDGQLSVDVPEGSKYYDIMLVSDFHMKEFNDGLLADFDMLNEYCVNKGISLVLNLGDFYNGNSSSFGYDNAVKVYNSVEESILKIPNAEGVYHALLGGNHEKSMARYGFDPIDMITKEREDFINLGYTHSTIKLENSKSLLGKIDVHHPDNFYLPLDLNDDGLDMVKMDDYLAELYERQGRSRDDSYIDIFGHMHKSQFNYPGSYYYLPPFSTGKACHLRIYMDEDTDIKYMVFMPLNTVNHHLVKNNEIVYQKILQKQ